MIRRSVLYHVVLIAAFACAACSPDVRTLDERVRDALNDRLQQYDVHGASVAVVLPNDTLHRICAGFSHDSIAMAPHMLFAVGSITKNLVAALILRLAEDGILSLEDPLHRWLPSLPHIDSSTTIRQMLNHTSGIFMFWENQRLWDDLIKFRDSVFTPEVVLTYLKEPYFAPGKSFRYSNTNYLLLAMIATRATHSTLSVELRKHFWGPLGLKNTYLSMEEQIPQERLAHGRSCGLVQITFWGKDPERGFIDANAGFQPRRGKLVVRRLWSRCVPFQKEHNQWGNRVRAWRGEHWHVSLHGISARLSNKHRRHDQRYAWEVPRPNVRGRY
jgi:CubicO group peptidase (beta-lactamase class C family)